MVRQVYIAQKMCSVAMILYFKKIRENTIFVKKNLKKMFSRFLREIAIPL